MGKVILGLLLLSPGLFAYTMQCSATADDFTILVFSDTHCHSDAASCAAAAAALPGAVSACNVIAIGHVGDVALEDGTTEWQPLQDAIVATGLPYIQAPGNHDDVTFNAQFANIYAWTSCYPSCSQPRNQYIAVNKPVRSGIIYLGLLGLDHLMKYDGSTNPGYAAGRPGTWASGILSASDYLRQFVIITHGLLAQTGTGGVGNAIYCNDSTTCSWFGAYEALGTEVLADFLEPHNDKIRWTVSGHTSWYGGSTSDTYSGHTINSVEQAWYGIWVLRFRPSLARIDVSLLDMTTGAAGSYNYAGESWAWTPNPVQIFPMPGGVTRRTN